MDQASQLTISGIPLGREIDMKPLPIVWQRLVSASGTTCPRCNDTGQEIQQALDRLKVALEPLGIEPKLETREISEEAFKAHPAESNRIWIAGKPMEDWLAGSVGSSRCCSVCGDSECRTVEVEGKMFETIPESLVVRAALIAASQMLDPASG
ncbi:MAG: heavy metal sensor signal transduction histidine kinase [Proteobacteria bacterium]|nr:heavy metal sensor signal transduction histidine kinase [Pseudomonadota bacterium]